MSSHSPFKPVEPLAPVAAYVDREFVKHLIDSGTRHLTPRFDEATNELLGVTISGPLSTEVLKANLGDYIAQHPGGRIEVLGAYDFNDRYQFLD